MNDSRPDALTRLFRACDPNVALEADDPRYVNCDAVRGTNLVRTFARSLQLADPSEPEVKVFAGHRGVGKTSELLRLEHALEHPEDPEQKPFLVIFADVARALDLNDLDFPDLLAFMASEIQQQLGAAKIPGFSATSRLLRELWDGFFELLGAEVTLEGAGAEIPYAPLALELKNRPSSRRMLREAIEKQSTSLIQAVNDLLRSATVALRKADRAGLVVIVDGLDKLVRRDLEGSNTHERLFIERSEQLASLHAHVIYTVPISLIYSPRFTQLEQTFGEHQVPVPMIRLHEQETELVPESPGLLKMREMIKARCAFAEMDFDAVFDTPETCVRLCRMTGGHPRHLMMFLQAAVVSVDALPVTRQAVDQAIRNYGNSLLRGTPERFWPLLRRFATPQEGISKDSDHQEMLLLHVFEHMNGHPWYEVNPVLRELPGFAA